MDNGGRDIVLPQETVNFHFLSFRALAQWEASPTRSQIFLGQPSWKDQVEGLPLGVPAERGLPGIFAMGPDM